jgi:hypothetical protein
MQNYARMLKALVANMKIITILILTVASLIQNCLACSIDYTPIEQLIEDADHIFIGFVVEMNYVDYEDHINEVYEQRSYEIDEGDHIFVGSVSYHYRTVPVKVFKNTNEIPNSISGGYCNGAHVEGTKKYIIMTYKYKDTERYGSKAWASDNPYFKELEQKLFDQFKITNKSKQ